MQFLRRSLVGLFLLSVTLGLLAVAGNSFYSALQARLSEEPFSRPARERVYAVNVTQVTGGPVSPRIMAFGEIRARATLDLRAQTAGRITWIADGLEDGAPVMVGDLLARVDPTDAESALAIARSEQAEAEAELRDAERALELAGDELGAARDQAELRAGALARQRDLAARGVGTEAAIETAALALAAAEAQVLSRRQSLAQSETRRDLARTRLDRQGIAVANAQRDLADTEIRSALDGVLSEVTVLRGGLVTANEQIARVIDPTDLEVAFRLSTEQYARLIDGQGGLLPLPVSATLDVTGLDLVATGQLTRVDAAVGEGRTGRQIFARLSDAPGFRPGDFVSVNVVEPRLDGVAELPATALGGDGTVLAIDADSRLEVVPVDLLRRQGDSVLIRAAGLEGRQVVNARTPLLGGGVRVRVVQPEGAQAQASADPAPSMIALSAERRARLIAFVEGNSRMPAQAKQRVLAQLAQPEVPAQVIERIESRMGG